MNINWKILNLKRQASNDLVTKVTYECRITEDKSVDRKIGSVTLTGDTSLPDFVAYDDLTEEITLDWIFNSLGDKKIEVESELSAITTDRVAKRAARVHKNGTPWGKGGNK